MSTATAPEFAENLDRLRGLHRLSIGDLAGVLGISRQSVSLLLKGAATPSTRTLLRVEEIFDVGNEVATTPLHKVTAFTDPDRYTATEERLNQWRLGRITTVNPKGRSGA